MRLGKFRAWDKENKKMYPPSNVISMTSLGQVAWGNIIDDDLIPMFFTGLTDRNGTEDYAGNIWEVKYNGKIHRFLRTVELTWQGYTFDFKCLTGRISPVHANVDEEGIIIGNRYENPELLEK